MQRPALLFPPEKSRASGKEQGGGGKLPCPAFLRRNPEPVPRDFAPRALSASSLHSVHPVRCFPGAGRPPPGLPGGECSLRWPSQSRSTAARPCLPPRKFAPWALDVFRSPSSAGRPRPEPDATRAGRVPNLDARSFRTLSPGVAPGFGCRSVPRSVHIFRASRPKTFFTPTRAPRTEFP